MTVRTTESQRILFYRRHLSGQSYKQISRSFGVSENCVRYWCRRQRDGGSVQTRYYRAPTGLLGSFHLLVRYVVLRLRLEHPRWGPNRIRSRMRKRPSLIGLRLPSEAQIGRYLHQWPRFQREKRRGQRGQRPHPATRVHQRWQLDFKMGIKLDDDTLVNLHTVRDPVGEACLCAKIYPAGKAGHVPHKVTLMNVQSTLRQAFAFWNTLPEEVQMDHEVSLIGTQPDGFPPKLTLWLKGLGIEHMLIRRGRPTDNAEVERCHRLVNDYAIVGQERNDLKKLQTILDEAVNELAFELTSRAEGCQGQPPIVAHPELQSQPRAFCPEWELAYFDMKRVDDYLATFTWQRKVGKTGQIYMADRTYSVGRAYARQQVMVRFDPDDRCFAFYTQDENAFIRKRPIRKLEINDLVGLVALSESVPQQMAFPFICTRAFEGASI